MMTQSLTRADIEFTTGVETEIAKSATILVGRIKGYRQNVTRYAEAPVTMPADWEVTGEIETVRCLKGRAPAGPVAFSREERTFMLSAPASRLYWEPQYGDLVEDGQAVAFLAEGKEASVLLVVPTGKGEQDLAHLVSDIVRFRRLQDSKEKFQAWTEYLASAEIDEGRKVALRVLCRSGVKWERLRPYLGKLLSNSKVGAEIRVYGFSIIVYHIINDRWPNDLENAVDFVGDVFSQERDPDVALAYLSNLGLIARYCHDDRYRTERAPLLKRVLQFVRQRKRLTVNGGPPVDSEDEEYYKETRADILADPEPLDSEDEP